LREEVFFFFFVLFFCLVAMALGCRSCGVKVGVLVALVLQCLLMRLDVVDAQGTWQLLLGSAGIASMHTAVTHDGPVIFLDRTDIGASKIALPNGECRNDPNDQSLKHDCTAHSVMFNPATNTVRPLFILTDTWCSSGQFFPNGTLVQTGGDSDGNLKIRTLSPCGGGGTCDWVETNTSLASGRWYSSNQLLPDGSRQIVVGGRSNPTYEFVPKRSAGEGTFPLALLTKGGDNLYPYVHLLPDGNLFIFASRDSVLLNWNTGVILRNYPTIPGNTRNYPAAGSSVLLPLTWQTGFGKAEILICGGSTASGQAGPPASTSCGRMEVSAANATWAMETMPVRRNMGDMIIQPNGDVLIINGAQNGAQGWGMASNPALQPCNYATNNPAARFTLYNATTIPRVYHSTANLLPDGRVLVAGSNTHQFYTFTGTFPTELRVEAFSPPYLGAK
jgi:hypothetical protein